MHIEIATGIETGRHRAGGYNSMWNAGGEKGVGGGIRPPFLGVESNRLPNCNVRGERPSSKHGNA